MLGNYHAGTAGQTEEKADQHIDDGTDGADGGKRLVADVVPHNPGVHGVVKLLKNISDQERQREID